MQDDDDHNQKDNLKLKEEFHPMTQKIGVRRTKNKWQVTKELKRKINK